VVEHGLNAPARCSICGLREVCLARDLPIPELISINELIGNRAVVRGDCLYRSGDEFDSLYTVRSGFFKTVQNLPDGRERVTGFHMAGDMLGAAGIGPRVHECDAVALEDSHVCSIRYSRIEIVARNMEDLHGRLYRAMSGEIAREHSVILLLGMGTAEERLAEFLLDLSQRLTARGYSPSEFNLRMSRYDIASYLGLKHETVSRTFSRFRDEGVIKVEHKRVHILDVPALNRCRYRKSNWRTN
jgi:CRP/FNR family transcriptional regulator